MVAFISKKYGECDDDSVKSLVYLIPSLLSFEINQHRDNPEAAVETLQDILQNKELSESSRINLLKKMVLTEQENSVNRTPGNNIAYFIHLAGLSTPENDQDLINIAKFTSRKIRQALIAVSSQIEEEVISERPQGSARVFFNDPLLQKDEIIKVT